MKLTEEEAKKTRCQESFGPPFSPDGSALTIAIGMTQAVQTSPTHCIASECMAWRWTNANNTRGYCGKAGPP